MPEQGSESPSLTPELENVSTLEDINTGSVSELTQPERSRRALTQAEKRICIAMRQEGLSYQRIADTLKRSSSVVYAYLEPLEDTSTEALAKLRAGAAQATDAWLGAIPVAASEGNHKPSKELLESIGVITRQADQHVQVAVQVNTGESQSSARMPQEMIDVTPE